MSQARGVRPSAARRSAPARGARHRTAGGHPAAPGPDGCRARGQRSVEQEAAGEVGHPDQPARARQARTIRHARPSAASSLVNSAARVQPRQSQNCALARSTTTCGVSNPCCPGQGAGQERCCGEVCVARQADDDLIRSGNESDVELGHGASGNFGTAAVVASVVAPAWIRMAQITTESDQLTALSSAPRSREAVPAPESFRLVSASPDEEDHGGRTRRVVVQPAARVEVPDGIPPDEELRPQFADVGRLARRGLRAVVGAARASERPTLARILGDHLGAGASALDVVEETLARLRPRQRAGRDGWCWRTRSAAGDSWVSPLPARDVRPRRPARRGRPGRRAVRSPPGQSGQRQPRVGTGRRDPPLHPLRRLPRDRGGRAQRCAGAGGRAGDGAELGVGPGHEHRSRGRARAAAAIRPSPWSTTSSAARCSRSGWRCSGTAGRCCSSTAVRR